MKKIEIGKIVNLRGLNGELKIMPLVDDHNIFDSINHFYFFDNSIKKIISHKFVKNCIFAKFEGINSIDIATSYKNTFIYAEKEEIQQILGNNYFVSDLVNAEIFDNCNEYIGKIIDIETNGTNDYFVIQKDKKSFTLIVIDGLICSFDIEQNILIVDKKICEEVIYEN